MVCRMPPRRMRLLGALVGMIGGHFLGAFAWVLYELRPEQSTIPHLARPVPLPHHIPKYEGGLSLRFAMVHDVIHERFPRHGEAHYRYRNQRTKEQLTALAADDPARFPLLDDLAAGLDRLGRSGEAVDIIRAKLAAQQEAGLAGRTLYTSYANLGTFLIHANFRAAISGDPQARAAFREGVGFIQRAVRVNPSAHFGREAWQAATAEFLLAAMDEPSLLKRFDCLGNDLSSREPLSENWYPPSRPAALSFESHGPEDVPAFFVADVDPSDPAAWSVFQSLRKSITQIGAESNWRTLQLSRQVEPVPFDEPVLGIIGMWRQGGGANPHFALALGETMLRVGQRYIAWTAFARAEQLANRYWPDVELQEFLRQHCRRRQKSIAHSLAVDRPPFQVEQDLTKQFNAELELGVKYQQAYQAYEAAKLEAGALLFDESFYVEFHQEHKEIASKPGAEEFGSYFLKSDRAAYSARLSRAFTWLGSGLGATAGILGVALFTNLRAARTRGSRVRSLGPEPDSPHTR